MFLLFLKLRSLYKLFTDLDIFTQGKIIKVDIINSH